MATITLRDATTGIRPDFELEIEPERRSVDTPDGAGAAFSRQINERSLRRWRFVWTFGTEGQRHILETKWADSGRGALPMSYLTEDGSETVEVKFVKDSLRVRQTGPQSYEMGVDVEELRSQQLSTNGGYNVIVFLVDDAGREYYKGYDNATYSGTPIPSHWANQWSAGTFAYPPTPILDGLANNGVLLSRMNVAAMCSPTRSSILTGRDNRRHTLGNAIQGNAAADSAGIPFSFSGSTIYKLLEDQGSPCVRAHIGKWHMSKDHVLTSTLAEATECLRKPVDDGRANYYQGHIGNMANVAIPGYSVAGGDHTEYVWTHIDERPNPRLFDADAESPFYPNPDTNYDSFWQDGTNVMVRTVTAARTVIEEAEEDGTPFLMHVWFNAVHSPDGWDQIGGVDLHNRGYHSYGSSNPGGAIAGDASHPGIIKAFVESVDTAMGQILAAMTADQASKTMVVFITDNGSTSLMMGDNSDADVLEPAKDVVPVSDYETTHTKRSPWQGGIGAACVINGPAVLNPGDGSTPRVWNGLCGVEDVFHQVAEWVGAFVTEDSRYGTSVLRACCDDSSAVGRETYFQRAFQNGYSNNMFSTAQGNSIRSLSVQNDDGWKLIWLYGGSYTGSTWLLYDMTTNPLEADTADSPTHEGNIFDYATGATMQAKYADLDNVQAGAQAAFEQLYSEVAADNVVPPGMEVVF